MPGPRDIKLRGVSLRGIAARQIAQQMQRVIRTGVLMGAGFLAPMASAQSIATPFLAHFAPCTSAFETLDEYGQAMSEAGWNPIPEGGLSKITPLLIDAQLIFFDIANPKPVDSIVDYRAVVEQQLAQFLQQALAAERDGDLLLLRTLPAPGDAIRVRCLAVIDPDRFQAAKTEFENAGRILDVDHGTIFGNVSNSGENSRTMIMFGELDETLELSPSVAARHGLFTDTVLSGSPGEETQ